MNLIIYTAAADKSQAAVTSLTDTTPVTQLEDLVLGDSLPLTITFTDGTAAPGWAGTNGYLLSVGLGIPDVNAQANKATNTTWSALPGGWTGRLNLATQGMIDAVALAVGSAADWTRFPIAARTPYPRPYGGWFVMQIAVTDPSGNFTTYAELRVFVRNRVVLAAAVTDRAPTDPVYPWVFANAVLTRTLTGIASNTVNPALLCGIVTANGTIPVGAKIHASFPNNIQALFEFIASTATISGFLFQSFDYNASTNPYQWRLRSVWVLGMPAVYNGDTGLWHFIAAEGAAGAVALATDQTGLALPT